MDIKIKKITVDEWEKYRDIRLEMLKEDPQAFLRTYEEELETTEEKWKSRVEKSLIENGDVLLFADDNGKSIGMGAGFVETKPKTKHIANIYSVYVKEDYRGKGIGKMLIDNIINELKKRPEVRKIKLGVSGSQIPAQKLYEKCGFKVVGVLKDEMRDGDKFYDEILMERFL